MSDPVNSSAAAKKKSKKRKKKTKGQLGEASHEPNTGKQVQKDKVPKQSSEGKTEQFITTKCCRCKGTFRRPAQNGMTSHHMGAWMCSACDQAVRLEESSKHVLPPSAQAASSVGCGGCNCGPCVAKRENTVTPEVEKEAHITQTQWMEIRQIVRCIYRENMMLSNQGSRATIGSDKMKLIVKKLCSRDPHQFFQRLETLAREYLLEVKVRLLEQLSCGFNSPQLAIEFIQMLLDEYSALCNALPALLYLLDPLEECEYVNKLGMTIELMNKNIFRELIFAESFMSSNLPLIIAQLRLASLASDSYHRKAADELSQRYGALDLEMEDICQIWRSAKDQLNTHQDIHRKQIERKKAHYDKIRADGESFKEMTKHHANDKTKHKENSISQSNEGKPSELILKPSTINSVLTPGPNDGETLKSKQALEWSKLLFKCIKPVGEPEFRLNGDIATHTITLHLDMTELDLRDSKPVCTRGDLKRYHKLGLSAEEVVEVTLKLNTLRALAINLKIEDLFDNEGFSLTDINEANGEEASNENVYFIDDEMEEARTRERAVRQGKDEEPTPSLDEEVDLQQVWESVLKRQAATGNGRSRQQDFLQGMTMKIRFMKRLTVEDLDKNFLADGGRVIFNSCDQVQMKLTQLELNSMRLVANSDCIGDDLGLDEENTRPPTTKTFSNGKRSVEDYTFVHTDSHKEFMDLLLEKRKQLESVVSTKQREKKATENAKEHEVIKVDIPSLPKNEGLRGEVTGYQESSGHSPEAPQPPSIERPAPTFKPVFLANSTQPCLCSACVGAMAATVQPSYHRPLNPTDPSASSLTIECSLSAHLGNGSVEHTGDCKTKDKGSAKKATTPAISKEGLWQNWMSTSGSAQIESESQLNNGSSHRHHHHHHYNCYHSEGAEGDSGYGDSIKSCSGSCEPCRHDHQSTGGVPSPYTQCSASHNHTGTSSPALGNSANGCHAQNNSSNGGGSGAEANTGESSRRYCPCCYCELFGHNGPPTAPTSHNFTKQRDKMRAKLEDKRKKKDSSTKGGHGHKAGAGQDASVDELVAFIEGEAENEPQTSSRAAKRQRRKQKKQALASTAEEDQENGDSPPSQSPDLVEESGKSSPRINKKSQHPIRKTFDKENPLEAHVANGLQSEEIKLSLSSSESDLTGSESDDYDDELEEFKKFCFAAAPVQNRKKIAIPLNMTSIISKVK